MFSLPSAASRTATRRAFSCCLAVAAGSAFLYTAFLAGCNLAAAPVLFLTLVAESGTDRTVGEQFEITANVSGVTAKCRHADVTWSIVSGPGQLVREDDPAATVEVTGLGVITVKAEA